ncbi:hypothetical protein BC739_006948 [Kutzneria viridogrisea]|uniref:Uncharacterized protein n=1 Tax=Kutzneria viridogrisea TaxID=47990 RepID=A0ABR6BSQ7_9PSEU|nr:hypothetical protein [Kutzneria viridogrisea]
MSELAVPPATAALPNTWVIGAIGIWPTLPAKVPLSPLEVMSPPAVDLVVL